MRPDLSRRLFRVAAAIKLLKKVALSEAEFIDRASKRSLIAMRKAVEKFESAITSLVSGRRAIDRVFRHVRKLIGQAGVVDQSLAFNSDKMMEWISTLHKVAPAASPAAAKLLMSSIAAARMQNADRVDLAKADPRYKEQFFKAQEKLSEGIQGMDAAIREIKFPDQPKPVESTEDKRKDTSSTGMLSNQLNEAHAEMLGTVQALSSAILRAAKDRYPDDVTLQDSLEQNIMAAMPGAGPGKGRKVNTKLNRDDAFYQSVLEMGRGSSYDLGDFLNTKNKKLIYQSYRSLIMCMRALGVIQFAKERPDAVAGSKKALSLVRKAHRILKKRKKIVVDRLRKLKASDDDEVKEGGEDYGTTPSHFDHNPGDYEYSFDNAG